MSDLRKAEPFALMTQFYPVFNLKIKIKNGTLCCPKWDISKNPVSVSHLSHLPNKRPDRDTSNETLVKSRSRPIALFATVGCWGRIIRHAEQFPRNRRGRFAPRLAPYTIVVSATRPERVGSPHSTQR